MQSAMHQRKTIHNNNNKKTSHRSSSSSRSSTEQAAAAAAAVDADFGKPTQRRRLALFQHSLKQHYNNNTTANQNAQQAYSNQILSETTTPIDRTRSLFASFPPFPPSKIQSNLKLIRDMFQHAYDSYLNHAWPAAEVHPITCQPGTFDLVRLDALTVLDALDTLLVLGNATEFARAVERLRPMQHSIFRVDQNVSLFETNIRALGGLLSAHQLALALHLDQPEWVGHDQYRVPKRHVLAPDGSVLWGAVVSSATATTTTTQDQQSSQPDEDNNGDEPVCHSGLEMDDEDDNNSNNENNNNNNNNNDDSDAAKRELQHEAASGGIPAVPCDKDSLSLQDCATTLGQKPPAATTTTTTTTTAKSTTTKNHTKVEEPCWKYDGLLLDMALDLGERLLPAFRSNTGIPFGTVNLLYGVPAGETTIASLAGGGTLTLEMELLSRLSGDDRFGKAAKLSMRALFMKRSKLDLFGKHIDIQQGFWTETLSGIGSNSDSFLEYLAKHYFLFPEDEDFWTMLTTAYAGIFDESRLGEWYVDTDMSGGVKSGGAARRVLESLAAFFPGLQKLLGEITPAARSLNSFFMVREVLGFLPERFNYGVWNLDLQRDGAGKHPLRPELLESAYLLHRASKGAAATSGWQWANDFALHKLQAVTRTECGYAGLREVKPQTTGLVDDNSSTSHKNNNKESAGGIKLMNEMPSFFLSETLKYLYLTFDEDNILHQDDDRQWIFTTEAHPIHSVPKKKHHHHKKKTTTANDDDDAFADDVEALKAILTDRVQMKDSHYGSSRSQFKRDLYEEKWTDAIRHNTYHDDLKKLSKLSVLRQLKKPMNQTKLLASFVPLGPLVVDSFGEVLRQSNAAHLALADHGSGPHLRKACPNLYGSDLLWTHALSGGAVDYADVYISVTHDSLSDHPIHFTLLGAADALGAQGRGVYLGEKDLQDKLCPIPQAAAQHKPERQDSSSGSSANSQIQVDEDYDNGATIYKFPSDIGQFEVSTYTDGSGFHVHHVNSGERMAANFISDNEFGHREHIAMIYTELRTNKQQPTTEVEIVDDQFTSADAAGTEKEENEQKESIPPLPPQAMKRSLSITDFESNAYSCEIDLIGRNAAPFSDDEGEADWEEEELLATFPCSPGLFGPSQISHLREQGDRTVVEAVIFGPTEDNAHGCESGTPSSPSRVSVSEDLVPSLVQDDDPTAGVKENDLLCENRCIHVVHRGDCTFVSKAINMEKLWNAAAVIVINTMDELFLMSSEGPDEGVHPDDTPLSVLITRQDGEVLLEVMHEESDRYSAIFCRISLERHSGAVVGAEGNIVNENGESDNVHWPVIRGQGNSLQILAEFGWGIQAIQVASDEKQEWQLQLLKHGVQEPVVRSE